MEAFLVRVASCHLKIHAVEDSNRNEKYHFNWILALFKKVWNFEEKTTSSWDRCRFQVGFIEESGEIYLKTHLSCNSISLMGKEVKRWPFGRQVKPLKNPSSSRLGALYGNGNFAKSTAPTKDAGLREWRPSLLPLPLCPSFVSTVDQPCSAHKERCSLHAFQRALLLPRTHSIAWEEISWGFERSSNVKWRLLCTMLLTCIALETLWQLLDVLCRIVLWP